MSSRSLIVVLAALAAVSLARPTLAAWPHNSAVNLPICTATGSQFSVTAISDGAGGAYISWEDQRTGTPADIYVQHVTAAGVTDPAWPVNGLLMCNDIRDQTQPTITPDGSGGAIVAWADFRSAADYDIYAQHVRVNGTLDPAWPVNGRGLCVLPGNSQMKPIATSDGSGGAIVAWLDYRNGGTADVFAQHVLASGALDGAWPATGRALCLAANDQIFLGIVPDGAHGAIVSWQDARGANKDIYAQHVLASGAVDAAWPVDGRVLCNAAGDQLDPTIVADGAGGAIVAWDDQRGANTDIYAQHVLTNGAIDAAWPVNGLTICAAAGNQNRPSTVSDGAGGAIMAWEDSRGASLDIYAQHVLPAGAVDPAWPVDGRAVCSTTAPQFAAAAASDGAGGAVVAWTDLRSTGYDFYAQHVLATGTVDATWPTDGRALTTATGQQYPQVLVSDGAGGAISAWVDLRAGAQDIYAQRVAAFGYLGTPEAEFISVRDVPNDQGGKIKVSWYASYLDVTSDPNLGYYELYRSVPPNTAAQMMARGAHARADFARPADPDAPTLVVSPDGANVYAWEYVTNQSAIHYLPTYSYVATTLNDSTGTYNPKTVFMIVARDYSGAHYWLSQPDSGYSADNLPPVAPAPFTGNYATGATHLHWDPNAEPDLANYRLYRGNSPTFVPGPANRIASPPDTGFADLGAAGSYYKLSAVDVHGNESPFTLLSPGATTAVGDGALPAALAFSNAAPNPTPGACRFTVSLPRASDVRVSIYDAGGRAVRTLIDGALAAGEHELAWDGRDARGHAAARGLYFAQFTAQGQQLVRRVAIVE